MTDNKPLSAPQLPRGYFARLVANGYSPLPTADKRCFLTGWQKIVVDARQAALWDRQRRWPGIGLRLDPPLCVIDVDVADPVLADKLHRLIINLLPNGIGPIRIGNAPKFALFVRYAGEDGPFNKRQSLQWSYDPEDKAWPKFRVEIYGGGSARYFGAFGPHEHDDHGGVIRTYRWPGYSPLDQRLEYLPAISREQSYAICDEADRLFEASGLAKVPGVRRGDAVSSKVYDLTPETAFTGPDGEDLSFDDLVAAAGAAEAKGTQFKVTGSFTGDRSSAGSLRGLVRPLRNGLVSVFDTKTGISHRLAGTEPNLIDASTDEGFAEIVRQLRGETR